ncbi:MAG TPA: YdeI/OmpD-associated family protein [Devosia sp.]|nr:YdeI/OmpD-associated family protein [Devosia sp.]
MRIEAMLLATGGNTTGIEIPAAVVSSLGGGGRPAVNVTINGVSYRTSIGAMGGKFMLPVSAERRTAAGVKAGDVVDLVLELDTTPREVAVPPDFAAALAAEPLARAAFDKLPYSGKQRHVLPIEEAKTAETRARRIAKAVEALKLG